MSKPLFSAERTPRLLHPDDTVVLPPRRSYFSELLQTVFFREGDLQCRPVLITSPDRRAGVSLICSHIATELATHGGRVLLAEVQALRSVGRRPGEDAGRFPERVESSRLWVLGARQVASRPAETRAGACTSVAAMLERLKEQYSHIVLDAPALSVSDDALSLAATVHGMLLVAKSGTTAKKDLLEAQQRFESLGGRVLGSIFNAWSGEVAEEASL